MAVGRNDAGNCPCATDDQCDDGVDCTDDTCEDEICVYRDNCVLLSCLGGVDDGGAYVLGRLYHRLANIREVV